MLDRWWLGTHQGAISPKHLDYYLDEYSFRYNRRRSRARGMLFYRLLQQATQVDPAPYRRLVGGRTHPAPIYRAYESEVDTHFSELFPSYWNTYPA